LLPLLLLLLPLSVFSSFPVSPLAWLCAAASAVFSVSFSALSLRVHLSMSVAALFCTFCFDLAMCHGPNGSQIVRQMVRKRSAEHPSGGLPLGLSHAPRPRAAGQTER
jgi:hypothetical protein